MSEANIKVAVRLRPPIFKESLIEDADYLKLDSERPSIQIRNNVFTFDHVFDRNANNSMLYEALVAGKIKLLFEGFNCTILAYGSTGSGKTFTMGSDVKAIVMRRDGLIHLGIKDIFAFAQTITEETDVIIKASFFEIYMENIKDLLKAKAPFVPGDSKEAKITNMTQKVVKTYDQAIQAFGEGVKARATGITLKNLRSSRSHAFFIISIIMTDKKSGRSKFSKFQFVDLAGSERAAADTTGKELKQGIQINKGLYALGRVISSLSKRERHVPYRDSILTRYLQDTFGGNSNTIMITCISPAAENVEETLSSLRYSTFARKIKNTITVNRDSSALVEHLKLEVERLKNMENCSEKKALTDQINFLNECLTRGENNLDIIRKAIINFTENMKSLEENMILKSFDSPVLNPFLTVLKQIREDLYNCSNELMEKQSLFSPEETLETSAIFDEQNPQQTSSDVKECCLEKRIKDLETSVGNIMGQCCLIGAEYVPGLEDNLEAISYINNGITASNRVSLLRYEAFFIKNLMDKAFGNQSVNEENRNEQSKTVSSSLAENFAQRIRDCEQKLNVYEDGHCAKLNLLNEATARYLLEYLYRKFATQTSEPLTKEFLDKYNLEPYQGFKKSKEELEKRLEELEQEKRSMELSHEQKILDINNEWERKLVDERTNRENNNDDEVNALKEKVKVLEEQRQLAELQRLPPSTSQAKGPRKKKSEAAGDSMMEAFLCEDLLTEDEPSFIQESERYDPDYRGTPLYKRNKLKSKRKLPEDGSTLWSPTPPKTFSPPWCNCPNDCSTIRCRCKKRSNGCTELCECSKDRCVNSSSSESS